MNTHKAKRNPNKPYKEIANSPSKILRHTPVKQPWHCKPPLSIHRVHLPSLATPCPAPKTFP